MTENVKPSLAAAVEKGKLDCVKEIINHFPQFGADDNLLSLAYFYGKSLVAKYLIGII